MRTGTSKYRRKALLVQIARRQRQTLNVNLGRQLATLSLLNIIIVFRQHRKREGKDMGTHLKEVAVNIDNGKLIFIYDDELIPLTDEGHTSIRRVSHVEPTQADEEGGDIGWTADMKPVDGPVLGPFGTRGEALAAEVNWLRTRRGL
jgi:hypothetical protein